MRRIIRAPADEGNLVARALSRLQLVLDIEHGVAAADALFAFPVFAFRVEQLLAERFVVAVRGRLFDYDFFIVVADLVDDPFGLLAQLEVVEGCDAFWRYGDTV